MGDLDETVFVNYENNQEVQKQEAPDELYVDLGKQYYDRFKTNPLPELKPIVEQLKTELGDNKCQACGNKYEIGDKFCKGCGNPLEGGSFHQTKEAMWINQKSAQVISGAKNMFQEIIPILKNPVTKTTKIAETKSVAIGMEFVIAKMVLAILVTLIVVLKVDDFAGWFVELPYLKIFFAVIVFSLGVDAFWAWFCNMVSRAFNVHTTYSEMITWVGTKALYDSIGMIFVALGVLISVKAALFIMACMMIVVPFVEFACFRSIVKCTEDKKLYIFMVAKIVFFIIILIIFALISAGAKEYMMSQFNVWDLLNSYY